MFWRDAGILMAPVRDNHDMQLLSLNTARAERLVTTDGDTVQSAIRKRPREGRIAVHPLGLEGDEQADLSVHGGLSKAVYAYPKEHYAFWATVRSQAKVEGALQPGAAGENLTISGLLETKVWLNDVLRFPDCELIVSEPRYPCFKFNAHMGFKHAVKMMAQSAYCGFYLAVKREGTLAAGERFELVPGPREVGVVELFKSKMKKQA
jgi:MOSC domain-containing protein YiiM